MDVPTEDPDMIQRMPEIFAPNVWPTEDLPELEPAMKSLMTLICDVGERLAHKCDAYSYVFVGDDRFFIFFSFVRSR